MRSTEQRSQHAQPGGRPWAVRAGGGAAPGVLSATAPVGSSALPNFPRQAQEGRQRRQGALPPPRHRGGPDHARRGQTDRRWMVRDVHLQRTGRGPADVRCNHLPAQRQRKPSPGRQLSLARTLAWCVARVLIDAEHLWVGLLVVLGKHDARLARSVCDGPPADRAAHQRKMSHGDRMAAWAGVAHWLHPASRKPLLPAPGRRLRPMPRPYGRTPISAGVPRGAVAGWSRRPRHCPSRRSPHCGRAA